MQRLLQREMSPNGERSFSYTDEGAGRTNFVVIATLMHRD
jgi:hypothetical protein